ncbi:SRPBCC family protein [Marinicellulosiphila megalodicopiae]|uniref:SRPBCC family protein n=1 Tax=Marinicellulosiphila megalodicopiae TaxID=2724896 RepID=UPI003BB19400
MIKHSLEIGASKEKLFKLTQDYSIRLDWDPFPESYKFINGSKIKTGLQIEVCDKSGRSMIVEYVSYKTPETASIKMIEGPWYIKKFAGSWTFKEKGNNTVVTFKYNILCHPKILTFFVNYFFLQHAKKRLASLKKYAEISIN